MHADFNWHKKLSLYRRLNLLIYINSTWLNEWGGELELTSTRTNLLSKVTPIFNRTVLFTTTDKSIHGHPHCLKAPNGVARNSIAIYYYISKKPKNTSLLKRTGTNYYLSDESKPKLITRLKSKLHDLKCIILNKSR